MNVLKFEELVLALSSHERKELIEKIQKSLSVHDNEQREIYHRVQEDIQHKEFLNSEIHNMSFWERFLLWIRGFFSTKSREEVATSILLLRSIRHLKARSAPILELDTDLLSPMFAVEVYELYRKVVVACEAVHFFWDRPERLQQGIEQVMADKIPNAKSSLFRFMNFSELVEKYIETESKSVLKETVLKCVEEYLQSIPGEVFRVIEEGITPIYYLKQLSQFPFPTFFSLFRVNENDIDSGSNPEFKPVSLPQGLDLIERLSYALYTAKKIGEKPLVHVELLTFYLASNAELIFQEDGSLNQESLDSVPENHKNSIRKIFMQIPEAVQHFLNKVPLADLLKVGYNDPFYRFIAYTPKLRIQDFYRNAITLRVLEELDNNFTGIRNEYIAINKRQLFPSGIQILPNFNTEAVQNVTAGMPLFTIVEPITTLYNFILQWFVPQQAEILRGIAKLIPPRLREIENNLLFKSASLEDCLIEIQKFDELFSQDTEEGKAYFRLRTGAMQDLSQQRAYRNILNQRDKLGKEIITRYLEEISTLSETFHTIITTNIEAIQPELTKQAPHTKLGNNSLLIHTREGIKKPKTMKEYLNALFMQYKLIIKTLNLELSIGQEQTRPPQSKIKPRSL